MTKIENKTVKINDTIIDLLENIQVDLAHEKYQTERRITTWNRIEKIINQKDLEFSCNNDKRMKICGMSLLFLGEIKRIDRCKASFIETLYLELTDRGTFQSRLIDHCVHYSVM